MKITAVLAGACLAAGLLSVVPARADHKGVGQRLQHQDERIREGVANGSISPWQANRMERRNSRIWSEAHSHWRHRNGRLPGGVRSRLEHQLSRQSRKLDRHGD